MSIMPAFTEKLSGCSKQEVLLGKASTDQLKEEIQAACYALQVSGTRATYFEAQLASVEVAVLMKLKSLATLKAECKALSEKSMATEEEIADRMWQKHSAATHLPHTAKRLQDAINQKTSWAQSTEDACQGLRSEERHLQALADSLEVHLHELNLSRPPIARHTRWHKGDAELPSLDRQKLQSHLAKAKEEAASAGAALASARRTQAAAKAREVVAQMAVAQAEEKHICALHELEEEVSAVSEHSASMLRQLTVWTQLHSSYEKDAIRNKAMCAEITKDVEDEIAGLRPALQRSVQLQNAAAMCPILAAWLASAWWLMVWGQ